MEIEIEREKTGSADVASLWSALTDFSKESDYWTNIRNVRVIEENGNTVKREAVVGPRGFGMKTFQTLTFDLGKSFDVEISGDRVTGKREISLREENERTKIIVKWMLDIGDAPGFVKSIVTTQLGKATEKALEKIFSDASK